MEELQRKCFVCNIKTDEWRSGLCGLMSQHSNTLITDYIKKILSNFISTRNIDDENNCICPDCLSKIEECDWYRITTERCEKELHDLLVRTENSPDDTNIEDSNFDSIPLVKNEKSFTDPFIVVNSDENILLNDTPAYKVSRIYFQHRPESSGQEGEAIDDNLLNGQDDDPNFECTVECNGSSEEIESDDDDYVPTSRKLKKARKYTKRDKASIKKIDVESTKTKRRGGGRPSAKKSYECTQCEQVFEKQIDFVVSNDFVLCSNSTWKL